jgi:hypothetical protein
MTSRLTLTLRQWLRLRVQPILSRHAAQPPYIVWCDPAHIWKELLQLAAEGGAFELWADEIHELILRQRFYSNPRTPRLVWLPVSSDEISFFKVYAMQAAEVVQLRLSEALAQFGVELSPDHWAELEPLLPAHARQWIDYPLSHWREHLSPGQVKTSLVDDDTFLKVLASPGVPLAGLLPVDLLPVLNRRAAEDFGLPPLYDPHSAAPEPEALDLEAWRSRAVAALLVTEAEALADSLASVALPGDRERVISGKAARDRSLKLLAHWKRQVDWMEAFENLALGADAQTSLPYWARNLSTLPPPLSSPAVENALFQRELERLAKVDDFDVLSGQLEQGVQAYQAHAAGFWGERAHARVRWDSLAGLAATAGLLQRQRGVEQNWKSTVDAVDWFTEDGWRVDQAGEVLFREDNHIPGALVGIRARLRKAYQRHLDRVNTAFAALLASAGKLDLPYAGDRLSPVVQPSMKQPAAVILLDACRYDIGCRIAEALNRGEPAQRADVQPAMAPLPSITPLGMAFALPGLPDRLSIEVNAGALQPWLVRLAGFGGNLAEAGQRREWLKQNFKLKDEALLTFKQVLDQPETDTVSAKISGRLIFIFDDELDDHDQIFRPFGLEQVIERCAALIRKLRAAGYSTVYVTTDHGFFHWEPDKDEKEVPVPEGEVLWKSRRAVVGRGLKHSTALNMPVPGSGAQAAPALECHLPRSINTFKTYGGLGFFHGGATLQELVIPFVTVRWPQKAQKIGAVLKPVAQITSLAQRIQVGPEATQLDFTSKVNENLLARRVIIRVVHPQSGKLVFKSKSPISIEPGGPIKTVELAPVPGAQAASGTELDIEIRDMDDEEILDRGRATLQVELDEWL